jgi:hypothetical protein
LPRGADLVRGPAGYGFERLPDGAPRLAYASANWRRAMAADRTFSAKLKRFGSAVGISSGTP